MRRPVRQYPGIYWAFAVLVLAAAYVWSMDYCTRGKWIAPLDDVYISLAYARNALDGFPFRFNVTDGPSTGATSFLYTWLLVPVCAICKGERSVIIGLILLNAVLLWLTCRISFDLASFCMPPALAHICVLGILLCGPISWAFFCGLETGLMITLILAFWYAWLKSLNDRSSRWWIAPAAASLLLALTRPEGAFLVLGGGVLGFVLERKASWRRGVTFLAIGFGGFLISLVPPLLITGTAVPSSAWAKTAWVSPAWSKVAAAEERAGFAVDALKGIWMGVYPAEGSIGPMVPGKARGEAMFYFIPGALVLFLVGALPLEPCRILSISGLLCWIGLWGLIAAVLPGGWNHHRYLIPIFPVFTLLSFLGIHRLGEILAEKWRRTVTAGLAGAWLLFCLAGLMRFVAAYGRDCEANLLQHRLMADIIKRKAEPGVIAAVEVGVLKYFTGLTVLDMKGLTAPWLSASCARGLGSLYDELKYLPQEARPRYAVLNSARPDVDSGLLVKAGILVPHLSPPSFLGTGELILYEFDWPAYSWSPAFKGWKTVDEVDCGNAASEREHSYEIWMQTRGGVPYNTVEVRADSGSRTVLGDAGWVLSGGEKFAVSAMEGSPLLLVMRTCAPRSAIIRVTLNGVEKESIPIAGRAERFQTILILQDDGKLVKKMNDVRIRCAGDDYREFSTFHYWVLQPIGK